jgi:hypothetical protein
LAHTHSLGFTASVHGTPLRGLSASHSVHVLLRGRALRELLGLIGGARRGRDLARGAPRRAALRRRRAPIPRRALTRGHDAGAHELEEQREAGNVVEIVLLHAQRLRALLAQHVRQNDCDEALANQDPTHQPECCVDQGVVETAEQEATDDGEGGAGDVDLVLGDRIDSHVAGDQLRRTRGTAERWADKREVRRRLE